MGAARLPRWIKIGGRFRSSITEGVCGAVSEASGVQARTSWGWVGWRRFPAGVVTVIEGLSEDRVQFAYFGFGPEPAE